MSTSGLPSVLPGSVSLEIGNAFTNLVFLPSQLIDANTGAVTVPIPGMSSTLGMPSWSEAVLLPLEGQPLQPPSTSNASTLLVN